jgi:hypothetical protein
LPIAEDFALDKQQGEIFVTSNETIFAAQTKQILFGVFLHEKMERSRGLATHVSLDTLVYLPVVGSRLS